jgi:outer membrane protein, heavy metal efflux system
VSFPTRTPRPAAFRGRAGVAAALALMGATAAHTEPAPAFPELLRLAQASAPRLAERQANIRAAEGRARQAGARPNPEIGIEFENFAGRRPYDAFEAAETTLSASQRFELGGKRAARVDAARADIDLAHALRIQAIADLGFELAVAYGEAEVAELRVTVARGSHELAQSDAKTARALVEAGREAELRIVQADAVVSAAQADIIAAEAEQTAALSRLTALAGSDVAFTALGDSVLDRAASRGSPLLSGPVNSPAVLAAEADREATARRIRIERTRSATDLTVSLGVRRFEEDGASALVAGASIPIPIFDRNQGATQAAAADLQAAEARLAAARLDAEADRRTAQSQAAASASRLDAAKAGETSAAEAYRLARLGYEAGRIPLGELVSTRRGLAEARVRTLDAFLARLRAEASIARLHGRLPFGDAQ